MNTEELAKVARAATPGPWHVNHAGSNGKIDEVYVYAPDCGVDDIAIAADIADPLTGRLSESNAAHIAAWSPARALAVLAVVEAARKYMRDCPADEDTTKLFFIASGQLRAALKALEAV